MSAPCTQFELKKPVLEKANCCNYTTAAVENVFFLSAVILNTWFTTLINTREHPYVLLPALSSTVFFYSFSPRLCRKGKL